MKTKKPLLQEDLINLWMSKYHQTTIQEEIKKFPELFKDGNWFTSYAVTKEQHDSWNTEAKAIFKKHFKFSDAITDRYWGLTYLNTSPYYKPTTTNEKQN